MNAFKCLNKMIFQVLKNDDDDYDYGDDDEKWWFETFKNEPICLCNIKKEKKPWKQINVQVIYFLLIAIW